MSSTMSRPVRSTSTAWPPSGVRRSPSSARPSTARPASPSRSAASRARSVRASRATTSAGAPSTVIARCGPSTVWAAVATRPSPTTTPSPGPGSACRTAGRRRRRPDDCAGVGAGRRRPRRRASGRRRVGVGAEQSGDALGDPAGGRQVEELVGPWALLPGTRAPVTTNWAVGKRSPSMPMNGIVPPSPNVRAGWPNAAVDASSRAVVATGRTAGRSSPAPTRRRSGPWRRSAGRRGRHARSPPGRRRGRTSAAGGSSASASSTAAARCPPARRGEPVGADVAQGRRHDTARSCSTGSTTIGRVVPANGNSSAAERIAAAVRAASLQAVGGELDVQFGQQHAPGRGVLEPVEQQAQEPEAGRHDAARLTGVGALRRGPRR